MKFKIVVLCLLIVFSSIASAGGGTWMPEAKKIKHIIIEANTALVVIDGGVPSGNIPETCSSGYNTIDLTTEGGRAMLSVALSARVSGEPVKLVLTCFSATRPLITHIQL